MSKLRDHLATQITRITGEPFHAQAARSVGGGCINDAQVLNDDRRSYFIKLNQAERVDMFEAEAEGLRELAKAKALRIPAVIDVGSHAGQAYLILEHIAFGAAGRDGQAQLGERLAQQHRLTAQQYGWQRDNTIGATAQVNTWSSDWPTFLREQRLGFQYRLAAHNGHGGALQRKGERLLADLQAFFTDTDVAPALLHGDLWSGNYGFDAQGQPVIFDPAVYYGDREADLAMTELFGGFSADFYSAYRSAYPLDAGYATRKTLYNLYHILNHLNLFGGGYRAQAERMTDQLLSALHG